MEQIYPEGEDLRPADLLDSLPLKLRDLGAAVEKCMEAELDGSGISSAEMRVLAVCAAHPGCTAVEISRLIPLDPPTVSRLVHPMTQRGLLSRRRSRTDRREVQLRATTDGLALLMDVQLAVEQASVQFLSSLSRVEQRGFQHAVDKLLANNS